MSCEICGGIAGEHLPGCPYFDEERKYSKVCCICNDYIYPGDDYIENSDCEYVHLDCVQSIIWLTDFLGFKVKTEQEDEFDEIDFEEDEYDF